MSEKPTTDSSDAGEKPTIPPTPAENPEPLSPTVSCKTSGSLTSPPQPRNLPVIPGYEILEELGRGGMSVVYKARDLQLNRVLALKMIPAGYAAAADLDRFRAEAQAIARLQHPNIVQVHEIRDHEGTPFFALEFCSEGSLAQRINCTPLPPRESAQVVQKLARAMHYAHQRAVIHRDLKPANVLLQSPSTDAERNRRGKQKHKERDSSSPCFGTPKVTDFGLAKKLDETGHTATGAIMGTPSYMAPEQAGGRAKDVGPATDIYALGAILYECLTGRPPFRGDSHMDVIMQVVSNDPVPPSQLQPRTPRDLETICLKCLQKVPGRRYATAADLAKDLRRFLAGEPILARPVGIPERIWKWARRKPAAAGFLIVLFILLGVASVLLIQDQVRRNALEARRQTLDNEIQQALNELDRTHSEFGDMLINLPKGYPHQSKVLEHEKWVKDTMAVVDNWQTQLRQARANWEKANEQALANRQLVSAVLTERLKFVGEMLQVDEAGLGLAKDVLAGGWDKENFDFSSALAATYCDQGNLVAHQNPKGAFAYYARAIDMLENCQWVHPRIVDDIYAKARKGLEKGLQLFPATVTTLDESFTSRQVDHIYQLQMQAGRVYVIELQSQDFSITLRWETAAGDVLSKSKNSVLGVRVLTPRNNGDHHLVANFPLPRNRENGRYKLTIRALKNGPDGRLFSGGVEIKRLDPEAGKENLRGHEKGVGCLAVSPDAKRLFSASDDGAIKVWDVEARKEILALAGFKNLTPHEHVANLVVSPDSKRLAAQRQNWVFLFEYDTRVWDLETGKEIRTMKSPQGSGLAFSKDGKRLLAGPGAKFLDSKVFPPNVEIHAKVWDLETGKESSVKLLPAVFQAVLELKSLASPIRTAVLSPDGGRLFGGTGNTIKIWELPAGNVIHTVPVTPPTNVFSKGPLFISFRISPNGKQLFCYAPGPAEVPNPIAVWDVDKGKEIVSLRGHTGSIQCLAIGRDGKRLVSGSSDNSIKIWDVGAGKEILTLRGHYGGVRALALSNDGKWLFSGGGNGTIKIWDLAEKLGERILPFDSAAAGLENAVKILSKLPPK